MITYYWSRSPGKFVNKKTGVYVADMIKDHEQSITMPQFTGSVHEWYETLIETIIDVQNNVKNDEPATKDFPVITTGPDVLTIIESTVLYKPRWQPSYSLCENCLKNLRPAGTPDESLVGTLANRFTVKLDVNLPRNKILVGDLGEVVIHDMNIV